MRSIWAHASTMVSVGASTTLYSVDIACTILRRILARRPSDRHCGISAALISS